jgi:hypothetical protein
VEDMLRLGFNQINKIDSRETYPQTHRAIFSVDSIKSGYLAAGPIPINPNQVLSQLNLA